MKLFLAFIFPLVIILAGCVLPPVPTPSPSVNPSNIPTNTDVVGTWKIYSESAYYDSGGSNMITPVTTTLEINEGGTWSFGSSSGTWSVEPISAADWTKWGSSSYGPTEKIVLNGWNGDVGDGPIEEFFIWVIYRVESPRAGIVQIKFGR